MTDQQRYDTIAALGFPYMHTPNLDRLVREGTSFDNCFITAPSCVPSRASLFTGYYPHTTGILRNGQEWQRTWVPSLAAQGYHCVNIGKMHTIPYDAKAGFHERFVCENKDRFYEGRWFADEWDKTLRARSQIKPSRERYRQWPDYAERLGAYEWTLPPESHADFFMGDLASWWLETRPKPEALFMQIGFLGPHPPYDPVRSYAERYLTDPRVPVPAAVPPDLDQLPSFMHAKRAHDSRVDHDAVLWSMQPTDEQLRRLRAYYLGNVSMIDEALGRLIDVLERKGYLDESLIVFTSDHGDNLGDHGLSQKWTMYDAVTRVPAIVWAPGEVPAGRREPGLCQLFDFGPTLLEWAGASLPAACEAQSLMPALRGEAWSGREMVFAEQAGDVVLTGASLLTMARDARYKAVHILGSDEGQLFDLQQDPGELRNLWDAPDHRGERDRLMKSILEWRLQSTYQTMNVMADAR
ncbi:MAG: sulfatase-like hydrolase/transferase [Gammaproteobacteria bacterium]|nr:sulfatase-like hydrolase/transferase [Gammaproteobacteria bacterium]MBU2287257.1 sulfatase-like hydrolase/transferase [Gammaproteobacteria bacterium]